MFYFAITFSAKYSASVSDIKFEPWVMLPINW